jgi:hypothetical protein
LSCFGSISVSRFKSSADSDYTVTAEDDTSIANDEKLPILHDFHQHIYNPDWHFSCMDDSTRSVLEQPNFVLAVLPVLFLLISSCLTFSGGTNHYKVLMDNFRLLSTAFLEYTL